ncbi:MAG: tetratricopeptide repeat protein [Candidatus Caenarcaniphilales bacterium]|nr:tetratricopeptide repeat protein [Candidatus Caenarcaniphilales bacterium]
MSKKSFILFLLFFFLPLSSIGAEDPALQAKKYIDDGLKKFTPCYLNDTSLANDCKKGCGDRCNLELKEQLKDKATEECNKICNEHCGRMVSQSTSQPCDLQGALNAFNKALAIQPNNPAVFINLSYVKIAMAKKEAFEKSNKGQAIKYLEAALSDAQKSKAMFASVNDQNGVNLSDNTLQTVAQNLEFLKKK